jgi:DNA-directed RNA polymerase subunit RPC12/RpoP
MPIRVTCNKCHTRFNVSEKFAGKEGPCPKCKTKILVPEKSEEVVIAAPKDAGPVDSKGRSILKPIRRKETRLSGVQITMIVVSIIGFVAASVIMRLMTSDQSEFPLWLMGLAALLIAPPLVFVAYTFLRDQELDPFRGNELWGRVFICSAVYALTWIAMPLAYFAFNDSYEVGSYVVAGVAMLSIGGVTGMFCFDFDYLIGPCILDCTWAFACWADGCREWELCP